MNKGLLTMLVCGQDRKFDFTRMGVYNYIKEAAGVDPFEFLKRISSSEDDKKSLLLLLVEDAGIIVYAGVNTALDVEGKDNISLTTAKKWANSLLPAELGKVFEAFVHGLISKEEKTDSPGEQQAPVPGA